jgi:hypothetical protein
VLLLAAFDPPPISSPSIHQPACDRLYFRLLLCSEKAGGKGDSDFERTAAALMLAYLLALNKNFVFVETKKSR